MINLRLLEAKASGEASQEVIFTTVFHLGGTVFGDRWLDFEMGEKGEGSLKLG